MSVTMRQTPAVKKAIAALNERSEDAWTPIEYTDAVFDEDTGQWISRAEVAEIDFTAFAEQKKVDRVPGRLIVRRIPDVNAEKHRPARTPCSTCGASTPSSPPPRSRTWIRGRS